MTRGQFVSRTMILVAVVCACIILWEALANIGNWIKLAAIVVPSVAVIVVLALLSRKISESYGKFKNQLAKRNQAKILVLEDLILGGMAMVCGAALYHWYTSQPISMAITLSIMGLYFGKQRYQHHIDELKKKC
ncbi:hypothetical protein FE810_05310 [Thalassotalea litorea]|uniref:Uncharacterized protein n=1 Tax=Thalassotalea litorea TaxID=2020715 RepID=A0A5R9IN15_9GAMM|nr:hypothetical protein [Thalassotalea litorea]TLU66925.1 hypothetical protein FE810_05310 [Thalassotalea litorea]